MKITHIGPESQFVSFAAETFEAVAPGSGEHFLLTGAEGPRGSYGMEGLRVHIVRSRLAALPATIRSVRSSDLIIAHSMSSFAALAFLLSSRRAVRLWSGWGSDYYGTDGSSDAGLLGPLTAELAEHLRGGRHDLAAGRSPFRRAKARMHAYLAHRAAARSDLFSAPIPSDLSIFQERFPEFHGEYCQVNYASIEHTFTPNAGLDSGRDIHIGNSATFSNNHLDAFARLANHDLAGRRVVVPLSYGDRAYRDVVLERGTSMLGEAFAPLIDYMPLEEYLATVGRCSVVIMNHRRQQAVGNVCAALYRGAHVFLHPDNPLLGFLRALGAVVQSIEDLGEQPLPELPATPGVVAANRSALEKFWGLGAVRANAMSIVRRIAN